MDENDVSLNEYFAKGDIFWTEDTDDFTRTDYQESTELTNHSSDGLSSAETIDNSLKEGGTLDNSEEKITAGLLPQLRAKKGRTGVNTFIDSSGLDFDQQGFPSKRGHTIGTLFDKIIPKSNNEECDEKDEGSLTKGSHRKGRTWSLLVDKEATSRVKSRESGSSALNKRISRSSGELGDKKSVVGLINFATKFNQLWPSANKSKSMSNLCDLEKHDGSKKRCCLHNIKSVFKEIFSPQRIVLRSEFVMIGQHGKHIGGMVATRDDSCWLFFRGGSEIARITHEGVTQEHLGITQAIDDLTMDDDENMYLSCPRSKKIKRIDTHGVGATFVNLRGYPRGIAYNSFKNEIVVCLNDSSPTASTNENIECNAVIRFSVIANRKKEGCADGIEEGVDFTLVSYDSCSSLPHLFCPVRVCVNTHTADYVFSDFLKRSIVIFDCNLKYRHAVVGNDLFESASLYRHPVVCCDFQGRLFVFSNRSGHDESPNCVVLHDDGKVMEKIFLEDLEGCFTHAANFDGNGRLWVASDNTVLVYEVNL